MVPVARIDPLRSHEFEQNQRKPSIAQVILDGNLAALTSLKWKVEPTIVLKIGFKPDLPVAAFLRPPAILSKGFRQKPFRRGIRKKASTFAQGDDALTILTMPDTEGYLTD